MKPPTTEEIKTLRREIKMTGEQFGRLFGFGVGAKTRISEIERGKTISGHVAVIYRAMAFIHKRRLLKKFLRENSQAETE